MNKKLSLILFLALCTACTLFSSDTSDTEKQLRETILYQEFQLTKQALEATIAAQSQATAQPVAPPLIVQTVEPTLEPVAPVMPPNPVAPTPELIDLQTQMKQARILLYEDMVGIPRVRRYVKETLEKMGLPYEDMGSAIGRLKERLLFGGVGGAPYDLIIIAAENRYGTQFTGEMFELLLANMDKNSAVILEAWHLDKISEGAPKPLLAKCGVKITNYTGAAYNEMDMVLWPTGTADPVLTEPNNYPKLTRPIFFWHPSDLGDLMELSGSGDAKLIIGRKAEETRKYGVVAVCMKGQLILQTFSSHSYHLDPMMTVWENYIYNALKVHFSGVE